MPEFGEKGYGVDPNTFYGTGSTSNAPAFAASLGMYKEIKETELAIVKNREGLRAYRDTLGSFGELVQSSMSVGNVFKDAKNELDTFMSDLGGSLSEGLASGLGDIGDALSPLFEGIGNALGGLFDKIGEGLDTLMSHWNNEIFPAPWDPLGDTTSANEMITIGAVSALFGIPGGLFTLFNRLFTGKFWWE